MAIIPEPGDGFYPGDECSPADTVQFAPTTAWPNGLYSRDDSVTYSAPAGTSFVVPVGAANYLLSATPAPVLAKAQWRVRVCGTGAFTASDYRDVGATWDWYDDPTSVSYDVRGSFEVAAGSWQTLAFDAMPSALDPAALDVDTQVLRIDVTSGDLTFDWVCLRVEAANGYYATTGGGTWSSWDPAWEATITNGLRKITVTTWLGLGTETMPSRVFVDYYPAQGEVDAAAATVIGRWAGLPNGVSGTDYYYAYESSTDKQPSHLGSVYALDGHWTETTPPAYVEPVAHVTLTGGTSHAVLHEYSEPAPVKNPSVSIPGVVGLHWLPSYDFAASTPTLLSWLPRVAGSISSTPNVGRFTATSTGVDNLNDSMPDYDPSYMTLTPEARVLYGWAVGDPFPDVSADGTLFASATVTPPTSPAYTTADAAVADLPPNNFLMFINALIGGFQFTTWFRARVLEPAWRYRKPEWDLAPAEDAGAQFQIKLAAGWVTVGGGGYSASGALKLRTDTGTWVKEYRTSDVGTTRPLKLLTAIGVWTTVASMV